MCACYFRYTVSVWDLGQSQYWQYFPVHLGTWSRGQNFFFRSASLFLCFLFYKVWLTSKHCKYLRCTLWCFDIRKVHLIRGRWKSIKNFLWKFSSSFLPSSLLPSLASSFIAPFFSFSILSTPSSLPSFLSSFLSCRKMTWIQIQSNFEQGYQELQDDSLQGLHKQTEILLTPPDVVDDELSGVTLFSQLSVWIMQKAFTSMSLYTSVKIPPFFCIHTQTLSYVQLFATPWIIACQAPLPMGFSRQKYWSGLPFPSPGDLSDPGIEPDSPPLQVDSFSLSHQGSPPTLFWNICLPNLCYTTCTSRVGTRPFNNWLKELVFVAHHCITIDKLFNLPGPVPTSLKQR